MVYEQEVSEETGKSMIIFNVSKGMINYSQKNNEYVWQRKKLIVRNTNLCNVTSICMGASYAGWHFPKEPTGFKQEEDRLAAFCLENKTVSDYYKAKMPVLWKAWQDGEEGAFPPNQVHDILEFATNLWFGSKVVKFSTNNSLQTIFKEIAEKNRPVVVSGNFPKTSKSKETINHVVVIVGLIYKERDIVMYDYRSEDYINIDRKKPDAIIVDDPWGNFIEGYEKNLSGNDVVCPYELAIKYLKPQNDVNFKWGYLFNSGAAII